MTTLQATQFSSGGGKSERHPRLEQISTSMKLRWRGMQGAAPTPSTPKAQERERQEAQERLEQERKRRQRKRKRERSKADDHFWPWLTKILGMLGSDQAGERAAAALKATELVRKSRRTWEGVAADITKHHHLRRVKRQCSSTTTEQDGFVQLPNSAPALSRKRSEAAWLGPRRSAVPWLATAPGESGWELTVALHPHAPAPLRVGAGRFD